VITILLNGEIHFVFRYLLGSTEQFMPQNFPEKGIAVPYSAATFQKTATFILEITIII
jgi:hypothetical protein